MLAGWEVMLHLPQEYLRNLFGIPLQRVVSSPSFIN